MVYSVTGVDCVRVVETRIPALEVPSLTPR